MEPGDVVDRFERDVGRLRLEMRRRIFWHNVRLIVIGAVAIAAGIALSFV